MSLGILVPSLIGLSLPHYTYQVKDSDYVWRVLLGFPVAVSFLQMVLFVAFFCFDPPSTYLKRNDEKNALSALKLVYTSEGAE